MANYKLKLKALLHNQIDKQYVMWCLKFFEGLGTKS